MFGPKQLTLHQTLALFWSLPPDKQDWANLEASGVQRVMLDFYVSATDATLRELQHRQFGVILRLNDHDAGTVPIDKLRRDLEQKRWACPNIDVLILGCEPEVGIDMRYGSPGWDGAERAWPHAQRVADLAEALAMPKLQLVTPGWECRVKGEDDVPQPGVVSWRDYCGEAYQHHNIAGHGTHIYGYGFKSQVDEHRVKWLLRGAKERFHRGPIYIDEVGFASGGPAQRMEQFVAFLRWLQNDLHDPQRIKAGRPPLLERVALICPFVANGNPLDAHGNKVWDPNWLMRDPASYALLGAFVRGLGQKQAA